MKQNKAQKQHKPSAPYPTVRWWVERKSNHATGKGDGRPCNPKSQAASLTDACPPEQKAKIKAILKCQLVLE